MSIYKRGDMYWYKFMWQGALVRESTKQGNDKVARKMEAAHRTRLAEGLVGIRDQKPVPKMSEFIEKRFEPWARTAFEHNSPQTWRSWYSPSLNAISAYAPLANRKLDEITSEQVSGFASHLQSGQPGKRGLVANSVNARLRVLRRIFHLAIEWGELTAAPKITMVPGARHRERVITPEEEARYLTAAAEPLASVATLLIDSGMRPEECFRQRWENMTWVNGRHGSMLIAHGKTAAARRVVPMTPRVRAILEQRWEKADKPEEGWIWPAPTKSEHMEPSTIKKHHRKALTDSKVRPFVLYTFRHTFLTRLGASGCDVWTLARIAGHSSIAISSRYVHPSENTVLAAMSRLSSPVPAESAGTQLAHR
jgi:integrase